MHLKHILFILFLDLLLKKNITVIDKNKQRITEWFALHAIVNLITFILCIPSVIYTIFSPSTSSNINLYSNSYANSSEAMCLCIWMHIYHCFAYKLTKDDILHHFLFVTLLAVPGYYYNWGIIGNCQLFFMNGLPGCIIYTLLVLQRCGLMLEVNEKNVSAYTNLCLRTPGILFSSLVLTYSFFNGLVDVPSWAVWLQIVLSPLNAIYYAHQSYVRAFTRC